MQTQTPKLKTPFAKKKSKACLSLERIIGLTSKSTNALSFTSSSSIAYTASGVISFYNPLRNTQDGYIFNQSPKLFSCLTISANNKYLAAGEGGCKQPEISIWDIASQPTLLKRLKGHKYGIDWVSFTPDCQYLISLGNDHDSGMFIWNWQQEKIISSNKMTKKVNCLAFQGSGDYFITGGVKSIKMWSFDKGKPVYTTSSASAEVKCMASKNFLLAEMKDKVFVSVLVANENVFALSQDGMLCVFTQERVMDKWVDLHTGAGFALAASDELLFCGCADGVIRCFGISTLDYVATMPRPAPLGQTSNEFTSGSLSSSFLFADISALLLFDQNSKLYCLYSDRSVLIWDISCLDSIQLFRSSLHHSASINQLMILPGRKTEFVTVSSDKTIRIWRCPAKFDSEWAFGNELRKVAYIGKNLEHFKQKLPEGEGCVKCVCCSADGKLLASGDSEGVLRVHYLDSLEEVLTMQAHDGEIVSVDFNSRSPVEAGGESGRILLATGSRDRLIHVFDVENEFKPVLTVDDHKSAISDLIFIRADNTDKLISCGVDRSLIFRTVQSANVTRYFQSLQKSKKCYTIQPHPIHKTVVIGEDKSLKILCIDNGKTIKEIEYQAKGVKSSNDSNLKLALDNSGLIIAASNIDKNVRIFEYYSGKELGKVSVGETVTSMAFSKNGKRLIMSTSDGCIFVWRLALDLVKAIRSRLPDSPMLRQPVQELEKEVEDVRRWHESIMPSWAKSDSTIIDDKRAPFDIEEDGLKNTGKWGKPVLIEFEEQMNEEVISETDEFDTGENNIDFASFLMPEMPMMRESFVVNKSLVSEPNEEKDEEEVKKEIIDEGLVEEEIEEAKGINFESEEFAMDFNRKSVSSTFWRTKKEESLSGRSIGLSIGSLERISVDREKMMNDSRFESLSLQIHELRKQLEGIEQPTELIREVSTLYTQSENPQNKSVIQRAPQKDSQDLRSDQEILIISQNTPEDISIHPDKETSSNPSSLSSPQKPHPSKQNYTKALSKLKKHLEKSIGYFSKLRPSDPSFSLTFEESLQERLNISELLISLSTLLHTPLAFSSENNLLESFSSKLVKSFKHRLKSLEKHHKPHHPPPSN